MEQNLFTEGVRPGSVTTPEEVHMLICYIFREARAAGHAGSGQ